MTVHRMDEKNQMFPSGRTMREVTPRELEDAIAKLLHEKTGNYYTVQIDGISFTKDPNKYDSGQFGAVKFQRDISREHPSIDDIASSFVEENQF
jgi:hypothetical protein